MFLQKRNIFYYPRSRDICKTWNIQQYPIQPFATLQKGGFQWFPKCIFGPSNNSPSRPLHIFRRASTFVLCKWFRKLGRPLRTLHCQRFTSSNIYKCFCSLGSKELSSANTTLSLVETSSPAWQKGFCRFELIYSFGRMIGLTVLPIVVPLFLMSVIYACTIVLYRRKVCIDYGKDEAANCLHNSYLNSFGIL